MMNQIPPYLDDGEPVFIKLARKSKAPKKGNSASDGPFYRVTDPEIQDHVRNGGNVGRVLSDDAIAIDVDDRVLLDQLRDWPDTLVIESGGSGFSCHYYYRCPDWEPDQKQLRTKSGDIGSVRSGNTYCVCPPSVHDTTGDRYSLENPRNPSEIPVSRLSELVGKFGTANTGGGRPAAGGVGGSSLPELPSEYPNKDTEVKVLKSWLQSNRMLPELSRTTCSDWSGLEFKLAKCLAEGGFSETSISDTLDKLNENSKWHNRGLDYQTRTVRKAIQYACQDPYVDFSGPADMDGNTSERRKTEESGNGRTLQGGDLDMVDDDVRTHVTNTNGGDKVVRSGVVEVENNGNEWEYVGVLFGDVEEEDGDLGTVVNWEYNQYNSKNYNDLGDRSPEELRMAAEALEELADEMEG